MIISTPGVILVIGSHTKTTYASASIQEVPRIVLFRSIQIVFYCTCSQWDPSFIYTSAEDLNSDVLASLEPVTHSLNAATLYHQTMRADSIKFNGVYYQVW